MSGLCLAIMYMYEYYHKQKSQIRFIIKKSDEFLWNHDVLHTNSCILSEFSGLPSALLLSH